MRLHQRILSHPFSPPISALTSEGPSSWNLLYPGKKNPQHMIFCNINKSVFKKMQHFLLQTISKCLSTIIYRHKYQVTQYWGAINVNLFVGRYQFWKYPIKILISSTNVYKELFCKSDLCHYFEVFLIYNKLHYTFVN